MGRRIRKRVRSWPGRIAEAARSLKKTKDIFDWKIILYNYSKYFVSII